MEKQNLERINQLSRIARERDLTPEEAEERQQLRQNYLRQFRERFRAQLESTVVVYPDGSREPVRERKRKPE